MSTGQDAYDGNAIMQKRGFLPRPAGLFHTVPRLSRAVQPAPVFLKSSEYEWRKFQHSPLAGFEGDLKATAIAADGEGAGSSGCGDGSRHRRFVVERS